MPTHQIEVVIPEDRRLVVEVPETIHSGPATLIFVTPSEDQAGAEDLQEGAKRAAWARWQETRAELARDPTINLRDEEIEAEIEAARDLFESATGRASC
jgi:hypothetical protein